MHNLPPPPSDFAPQGLEGTAGILESITDAFFALDGEWRFTFLNQQAGDIFAPLGKTRAGLLGRTLWDEFPRLLGTPIEADYRRAMRERVPVEMEAFFEPLHAWFFVRIFPTRSGLSVFFQDITARKAAEGALREAGEVHRALTASIDAGWCVIEVLLDAEDRPGDYLFHEVNAAFESQTGLANATGRTIRELAPGIEPFWWETYGEIQRTGRSQRFESHSEALNRWFEVFAFRIGTAEARRVGILFTDITERRRVADELRAAKDRAETASRAKDNFLAALSHELRTPLTPVLMTTTALSEDERLPGEVREQLGMVARNVALEAKLIDDLLDITRIANGKLQMRAEPCDVHSLIGQAVRIVEKDAREKGIHLALGLEARRFHLSGDPARLQQVLWNLLRNAVKFTPAGGRIDVRSHDAATAGHLCIEVSDTGIGFDPAEETRIFRAFEQAAHGYEHQFGGLGLGLAIAQAVVNLHHGTIRGESPGRGQGATFTVELPGATVGESRPSLPNRSVLDALPDAPLNLLVVEDHEPTINVLSRVLRRAGHRVTPAGSISAARALAAAQPFDAVVSDLGLPDGTGHELMSHLRDTHGLTGIALSGYGSEEDLRRSREAGFAAHLVKPVDVHELRRALRALAPAR